MVEVGRAVARESEWVVEVERCEEETASPRAQTRELDPGTFEEVEGEKAVVKLPPSWTFDIFLRPFVMGNGKVF